MDRPNKIEVWTEAKDDGRVEWSIRIDGHAMGGGAGNSHADCYAEAARFLAETADATLGVVAAARSRGGEQHDE